MKKIKYILFSAFILSLTLSVVARENVGEKRIEAPKQSHKLMKYAASCEPSTASADLDVNNVRTKILNGGDMWWDLSNPKYEIPKIADQNSVRKHSLFSGAIWVGGYDNGNTLKLAAMTYRQRGNDFWPGPLDPLTANTDEANCKKWDNIYKIKGSEIIEHNDNFKNGTPTLSENISAWPGRPSINVPEMAPFYDQNGDGVYRPIEGDYPVLQTTCLGKFLGSGLNLPEDQPDQMLYFSYNDKGNIHSESGAQAIGLELHTVAFAYATNDEINNMTFYTTTIVNRGGQSLKNTYFGQWVDADLGNYRDDYVGCDVKRSLGFCYNGDDNDEGILGYGLNPPSVGIDFFEGPKKDTLLNGRDTSVELGMSKFVYYNNTSDPVTGNPDLPIHFYYYLTGKFKNGKCMTCDNKNGTTGNNCTDYIFPFDTDPNCPGNWNERSAGNQPNDRRFLQTSGPFTLGPGVVNKLTVGVVWAKSSSGGAEGSLGLLKLASDKAQTLFNNCFNPVNGPDAPDTEVQELDRELVMIFGDTKRIENFSETVLDENKNPQIYKFEGYRIYQLKDGTVGTGDLEDVDKAREVFSGDLKNNVVRLINKPFDPVLAERIPKLMIDGPNKGLVHSLSLKEDAFASGSNKRLVNFKTYYYMIIAYAAEPASKQDQYLAGRFVERIIASPRNTEPRFSGSNVQAGYGSGPILRREEGSGNGGNIIDLTTESELEIVKPPYRMLHPTYNKGLGPVKVTVIDPLKVPQGKFEVILIETDSIPTNPKLRERGVNPRLTRWIMVKYNDDGSNDTLYSEHFINIHNEQVASAKATAFYKKDKPLDWGMSVTIDQVLEPGNPDFDETNGSLGCEVIFKDKEWLSGMRDIDGSPFWNWIHSGTAGKADGYNDPTVHDFAPGGNPLDPFENYEKLWEGRVGPYRLASRFTSNAGAMFQATQIQGVAFDGTPINSTYNLSNLSSVELVITPDKSKWTRSCVLEMSDDPVLSEGSNKKFNLRDHASIDINGNEIAGEKGRGWFPGYAINVETGERLNIVFGEDSRQYSNNGRDMKWNPTSDAFFYDGSGMLASGGRHYIYVMGSYSGVNSLQPFLPIYDEGAAYHEILSAINPTSAETVRNTAINKVMFQCMWVVPTYLAQGFKMKEEGGMPVPESEVRFKIRVKKPYRFNKTIDNSKNNDNPRYSFTTNEVYNAKSTEAGVKALDIINVVPNPYYAFSPYETSPIENRVKFTNLPERCDISIYTIDGTLVRRIKKDDGSTDVIWDLKNDAKVPIASGIFLIHVNAPGLGEKVLKWMGVMRELDLDSF